MSLDKDHHPDNYVEKGGVTLQVLHIFAVVGIIACRVAPAHGRKIGTTRATIRERIDRCSHRGRFTGKTVSSFVTMGLGDGETY